MVQTTDAAVVHVTTDISRRLGVVVGNKDMDSLREYGLQYEIAASHLGSDCDRGIAASSISGRMRQYGRNELPPPRLLTLLDFVKEVLEDKTMMILVAAAVVSLVLGMTTPDPRTGSVDVATGWVEGAAILLSVVIVTLISALNNLEKQRQFSQLMEASDEYRPLIVIRDGTISEVPNRDVVVGDVVMVHGGMSLSFDALLLQGDGVCCDESSVTGEADGCPKSTDVDPFLISGTSITDGSEGTAVVVAVGTSSFAGSIATNIQETGKESTPLQVKLEGIADIIGKCGLAAAVFTFGALCMKELYVVLVLHQTFYIMKLFENITTAVAIVVVAVPEGLPLSVTISLAYSMKRMLQDNNLVRHLAACETMGGATVICCDKTGTLTSNNMYVRSVFVGGATFDRLHEHVEWELPGVHPETGKMMLTCIAHNTVDVFGGNKTNEALSILPSRLRAYLGFDAEAAARTVQEAGQRVRFPFSSAKKQSSVVIKDGKVIRHYVIGAAELVLQNCNKVHFNGVPEPLVGNLRRTYEHACEQFMGSGLRCLCLAYSEKPSGWAELPLQAPPDEPLTLVAVAGIEEPLRADVPASIATCKRAGIRVLMLTGDSMATAQSIAAQCGIGDATPVCIDGPTFRSLSDDDISRSVLPKLSILARANPLDKQRLVQLLKNDPSQVVAVTGDGTNDAPALKSADIGFAMNSGSDIAKRASDIVLLDDSFVGMVKATMWGRNVRDNIRKFLQFQLTVNVSACVVAFVGALLNSQNLSPLKPVQLLWLNLIMDTLAALALATELPSKDLLLRSPESKHASIITPVMWFNIATQGSFQLIMQVWLLSGARSLFAVKPFGERHLSIVFNVFVMLQIFNFFNARLLLGGTHLLHNIGKSKTLLYIVLGIFVTQVAIIQRGGWMMGTVPLSFEEWVICIVLGSMSLVVGAGSRWYARSFSMDGGIVGRGVRCVRRILLKLGVVQ